LGNLKEANEELERIQPQQRAHPDVLRERWKIYQRAGHYEVCLTISTARLKLVPEEPDAWLYHSQGLSFLERYQEAYEELLPAVQLFPDHSDVYYDLACYLCQLNRLKEAKEMLKRSLDLTDKKSAKLIALEDPELELLWGSIGKL